MHFLVAYARSREGGGKKAVVPTGKFGFKTIVNLIPCISITK
jgi:hypothetical protein